MKLYTLTSTDEDENVVINGVYTTLLIAEETARLLINKCFYDITIMEWDADIVAYNNKAKTVFYHKNYSS